VPWSVLLAAALSMAAAGGFTMPASTPSITLITAPAVGETAPDFEYQSWDYRWCHFHDMYREAPVLLVFSPDDATLAGLEARFETLAARGVTPVAVLGLGDTQAWRMLSRMQIRYELVSDPRGDVAREFGAWDAAAGCIHPTWAVIGRDGTIRAMGRDAPTAEVLASQALRSAGSPAIETPPPSAAN